MDRPASADGLKVMDPMTRIELTGSIESAVVGVATPLPSVGGFGPFRSVGFDLTVTAVALSGGSNPTAQLQVWVQRKLPSGAWDDLLAFQTAALPNASPSVTHLGEYGVGASSGQAPALVQTSGGNPPFAQRGNWKGDVLRAVYKIVTTGNPTACTVAWRLLAEGRP